MRFTDEQIHEFCGYMRECKKCPQRVETSYGPGIPGCVCEVEEMLDAAVRIVSAASQPTAAPMPPNAPTLDEIRARCSENVTEMCSGAAEYYRMQTIIRDRAALLAYYDRDVSAHRTADPTDDTPDYMRKPLNSLTDEEREKVAEALRAASNGEAG